MKKVFLSGEKEITVAEVEKPVAVADKVLIKTVATGICGTDVHSYMGETIFGKMYPFHIGHEVAGIVEAVGPDCKTIKVGDHVVIDPLIACGVCEACRKGMSNHCSCSTTIGRTGPGGFSDYILTPETSVYAFDPKMDFETAALAEPLACVMHGIERARIGLGDKVLVKGVGSIGQMHMLVAKLNGASVVAVTDFNQEKLQRASSLGADFAVFAGAKDFDAQMHAIAPNGFDVVIDCTGAPASVAGAVPYVKNAGTLLIFGVCPKNARVEFSPHEIYIRELSIVGSFAFPKETLIKALSYLSSGRITAKQMISAVLPREQLAQAIEDVGAGKYDGKVIIATQQ